MKNIDVALIHRVLDSDNTAFTELVNKYQKPVHALVWRKVGDFHIAEEITQDTFLKAYQRLATLKKPQRFSSWLYVIAANHCSTWLRKKRLRTQSLEETSSAQLEKATYSGYVIEENERTATETRREAVKKLLAKLQESERTVITLHYFGEMSSVEIGAFLGVLVAHSIAQEAETGTFSGRVVDIEGNPVAELPVMIGPTMVIGPGIHGVCSPMNYPNTRRARTDADGRFTITDITPRMSYFSALPQNVDAIFPSDLEAKIAKATAEKDFATIRASGVREMKTDDFEPDFEVLSIDIQGVTFYPRNDFSRIGFSVEPGSHIKNVQVTVQPRMRIRGRVLFKDGTPLRNARLRLGFNYTHENGQGSSGGSPRTDADGYFLFCLDEKDDPANYTFSVEYQALEATAEPVLLEPGDRLDGLTFTFDSEPIAPKPPPHKMGFDPSTARPAPKPISIPAFDAVWIVNPANGHAYKRIPCESREDAVAQATAEKAHLVTINDAAEQAWLTAIFGHEFYWIGLSDTQKEGQWQWDNGEPVTYENWLPDDFFSESSDAGERDYGITTLADGKWYTVSPDSLLLRMTAMAILEKTDVLDRQ